MGTIKSFEELDCLKEARLLVVDIYKMCGQKNLTHKYEIQDQIKRATISIMNNIAEGYDRKTNKEFLRFLSFSLGSSSEVKSMLYLLLDLKLVDEQAFTLLQERVVTCQKLIKGLMKYLNKVK